MADIPNNDILNSIQKSSANDNTTENKFNYIPDKMSYYMGPHLSDALNKLFSYSGLGAAKDSAAGFSAGDNKSGILNALTAGAALLPMGGAGGRFFRDITKASAPLEKAAGRSAFELSSSKEALERGTAHRVATRGEEAASESVAPLVESPKTVLPESLHVEGIKNLPMLGQKEFSASNYNALGKLSLKIKNLEEGIATARTPGPFTENLKNEVSRLKAIRDALNSHAVPTGQ